MPRDSSPFHSVNQKSMAKPTLKPLERPVVDVSLTKSAFVGNLGRVKELLEPASGKAPDVSEKDMCAILPVGGCEPHAVFRISSPIQACAWVDNVQIRLQFIDMGSEERQRRCYGVPAEQ
jgi:hypothetical protein